MELRGGETETEMETWTGPGERGATDPISATAMVANNRREGYSVTINKLAQMCGSE